MCQGKTVCLGLQGETPTFLTGETAHTPDFFGFPKDGLSLVLFPDVEEVGVEFFVIVVHLEECTSVRIHQVFCIYLQHRGAENGPRLACQRSITSIT